jgi:hypothetical protein
MNEELDLGIIRKLNEKVIELERYASLIADGHSGRIKDRLEEVTRDLRSAKARLFGLLSPYKENEK